MFSTSQHHVIGGILHVSLTVVSVHGLCATPTLTVPMEATNSTAMQVSETSTIKDRKY